MNINDLPIDCLILVFQKFSLQHRILLRSVCSHWNGIIEQQICQLKRSLKLFGCSKNVKTYCLQLICENSKENEYLKLNKAASKTDDLILINSNIETFNFLARLFPQLEHLVIHFDADSPFKQLPHFLALCPNLVSLSLCGSVPCNTIDFVAKLSQAINSLTKLKRLDLLSNNLFLGDIKSSLPIEMPNVLPQLEHISLLEFQGDLCGTLKQLSANCKSLRLDSIPSLVEQLPKEILPNSKLTSTITHLRISLDKLENAKEILTFICDNFKQLEYLDFQCCPLFNRGMVNIYLKWKYNL